MTVPWNGVAATLEWAFWVLTLTLVYVYLGYPTLVFLISRLRPHPVRKTPYEPTVSIIIAAHNEEAHIAATLDNKLSLAYPASKLQIIVVSDASIDATDAIVRSYEPSGVLLLRQQPRNGKTGALALAVPHATGDVLVFADANSLYDASALQHLVGNFADPMVGYVTGKLAYLNPDGSMTGDGCSLYMKYENFVRTCESLVGSVVGVNGGIDAVRRGLYEPMDPDDLPDLILPLRVVSKGFRCVYDPSARLSEVAHDNPRDEYRMRVRVAQRALWAIADMRRILNVWRYGFYSLQVLSHKVLRYLAFLYMLGIFVSSALLWPMGLFYKIAVLVQVVFLVCAWFAVVAERHGRASRLLSIPYYFLLVNAASLLAFARFLRGERNRIWNPRLG